MSFRTRVLQCVFSFTTMILVMDCRVAEKMDLHGLESENEALMMMMSQAKSTSIY